MNDILKSSIDAAFGAGSSVRSSNHIGQDDESNTMATERVKNNFTRTNF